MNRDDWPKRRRERQIEKLDLGVTTVDEQFDAGDVTGVIGSQEGDGFGNFIAGAHAAHGYAADEAGFELLFLFRVFYETADAGSLNWTWAYRVNTNVAVLQVRSP